LLYRQSLQAQRRLHGFEHPNTRETQGKLAAFLDRHGQKQAAEQLARDLLTASRKLLPPDHPDVAFALVLLGDCLSESGRAAEAEPLLRHCLTIREKQFAPGNWRIASARSVLGACLARQKKFAEAEPLLLTGYERLTTAPGARTRRIAEAHDRVIDLYEKWGKPAQAAAWRKKRPAPGR
jgi:hypothetical protein